MTKTAKKDTKKLTARERKLLSRPKVRVISETSNEPNRAQRRAQNNVRTSTTLHTKKRTVGRLTDAKRVLLRRLEGEKTPEKKNFISNLISSLSRSIGALRK